MRRLTLLACIVMLSIGFPPLVPGQVSDAALRDRVGQLVDRLDADDADRRASAEEALIALGPRVLPLLPDVSQVSSDRQKEALVRVREALSQARDEPNLGASTVTIQGEGIRLSEAIRQLQAQSGNPIFDLREQFGDEVSNPALDLDLEDVPFFEALDQVTRQAGLSPYFYTGDGSIGLVGGAPEVEPFVVYSGPFRVQLMRYEAVSNFETGSSAANVKLELAWEPRLRPMLLALRADQMEVLDDRGATINPSVMQETNEVVLRPENPVAELNLNMETPDREAKAIDRLKVQGEVSVPADLRTFRFPSLTERNVQREQGGVSMTLRSTEVDEHIWKVNVLLEYPGGGPVFESYRQGLFNNRLWLQRGDGSQFEHNGGFSITAFDQGRMGFEYLFVDVPGNLDDYQFVYETPGQVETLPLEFELRDIPLP